LEPKRPSKVQLIDINVACASAGEQQQWGDPYSSVTLYGAGPSIVGLSLVYTLKTRL